jgi:large subunit ribosomal protein L24
MDLRKYAQFALKAGSRQKQRPTFPNRNIPFLSVSNHFSKFPTIKPKKREILAPIDYLAGLNLQRGDLVRVLYGKDAGREGIIKKIHKNNQITVSGTSLLAGNKETLIHVLNVVPLDPVLKRATRIKTRYSMNGEKVRISKLSRCAMPKPVKWLRPQRTLSSSKHPLTKPNRSVGAQSKALHLIKHRLASSMV